MTAGADMLPTESSMSSAHPEEQSCCGGGPSGSACEGLTLPGQEWSAGGALHGVLTCPVEP